MLGGHGPCQPPLPLGSANGPFGSYFLLLILFVTANVRQNMTNHKHLAREFEATL